MVRAARAGKDAEADRRQAQRRDAARAGDPKLERSAGFDRAGEFDAGGSESLRCERDRALGADHQEAGPQGRVSSPRVRVRRSALISESSRTPSSAMFRAISLLRMPMAWRTAASPLTEAA